MENLSLLPNEEMGKLFKEILALAEDRIERNYINQNVSFGIPPIEIAEIAKRYNLGRSIVQIYFIANCLYFGGNIEEVKKESLRIAIAEDMGIDPKDLRIVIGNEFKKQ